MLMRFFHAHADSSILMRFSHTHGTLTFEDGRILERWSGTELGDGGRTHKANEESEAGH